LVRDLEPATNLRLLTLTQRELEPSLNHCEQVVQVVRQLAGQLGRGREPLCLDELSLGSV
jgi:hypothetical protein